ncbi:MAG: YchJ family metal-binding protein [Desulfovibrionaceae bacterium]|nr:YchJ family metal-binding protein [Desulfovibrionaceae bacterium]
MEQEEHNCTLCPCGSGKDYASCCQPYHDGKEWPQDAEQLVRARYSAYVLHKWQYLVDTHMAGPGDERLTAEELEERTNGVNWQGLNIVGSGICGEEEEDERGNPFVNFYAYYLMDDGLHQLGEHSFFAIKDEKLYYTGGVPLVPEPYRKAEPKVGRNDPCPCGSGKKYKKCCGKNA